MSIRLAASLLAAAGLAATALTGATPVAAQKTTEPFRLQHLLDSRIDESSGLETAANFRETLYTHNDSGDSARFFAVGRGGLTKALYTLRGADFRDWEDMAAGPNKTLWFADIGDNGRRRSAVSVYRVPEPTRLVSVNVPWTRYDFRYEDGESYNAEALLVHPTTGVLYIATKQKSGAAVYRAPLRLKTSGYNTLTRVSGAPPMVTGGNFSPNSKRLVLRTTELAYVYSHIGGAASVIDLPIGGESVTFSRNGADLLVGREGSSSPVWRVPTS